MTTEDDGLKRVLDGLTAPTAEEQTTDAAALVTAAVAAAKAKAKALDEGWTDPGAPADGKKHTVTELAVRVDKPENLERWILLANRLGADRVLKMLAGGVRGVRGLDPAEKAVKAELERDKRTAAWMNSGHALTAEELATESREALLYAGGAKWLPGGIVGLVVASGGTGKTTWLAELAVRVAHGLNWPGLWDLARGPYRKGPVLLVMAEEDAKGAAYQIWRACKVAGVEGGAPDVHVWAGAEHDTALGVQVQLDDPVRGRVAAVVPSTFHEALCAKAEEVGPLLVILDPLNQLLPTGGSENDAVTAGALIRLAGEIRAAAQRGRARTITSGPDPVVLIAHHERKSAGPDAGADAARGSTAFVDNARWVCRMQRDSIGKTSRSLWGVDKSNYTRATDVWAKCEWDDQKRGIGFEWLPWGDVEEKAYRKAELAAEHDKAKADEEVRQAKAAGVNAAKAALAKEKEAEAAAAKAAEVTSGAAGWALDALDEGTF